MSPEDRELLNLYDGWNESRRALAYAGFLKLVKDYPNISPGDLWLAAIADEYEGKSPWL